MLAKLALRSAPAASRATGVLGVRYDSHRGALVKDSNHLSSEEIIARLDKDIKDRNHERFRWRDMGIPFTQTYVMCHYGFEYFQGGAPAWLWVTFGLATLLPTLYYMQKYRFLDIYVDQRNPQPDLDLYHNMQARLKTEPDFWNWDERDAAAAESSS